MGQNNSFSQDANDKEIKETTSQADLADHFQKVQARGQFPKNAHASFQIDQNQPILDYHNNQNKKTHNDSNQNGQGLSQSIPNLKSFVESRMINDEEEVQRGSDVNLKKPQFQRHGAKVLKSDGNYKKNLFSAMTTRVIRQQQEQQLNNSQLYSQRSLTSLHNHGINNNSANKNALQRSQSPNNIYNPYQNGLQLDNETFNSPGTMKKQHSAGASQTEQDQKQFQFSQQRQNELNLSIQLPQQDYQFSQMNQNQALQQSSLSNFGMNKYSYDQQMSSSFSLQPTYMNGGYSYQDQANDQFATSYLQKQLITNYEKARNLDLQQRHRKSPDRGKPNQLRNEQQVKYESLNLSRLPHASGGTQGEKVRSQNSYQQILMDVQYLQEQYSTPQLQVQTSQLSGSKERDQQPTHYKIKIKGNGNKQDQSILMMSTRKSTQHFYQKREIQFGGNNCPLDNQIVMTILLFDMQNFRKYICLTPQWHHSVLEAMDEYFKQVECNFVMKNYEYILFKKSYTNSSLIHFCGQKGIRVDRVLVCEVLNNAKMLNKCLRVSYSFKYLQKEKESQSFYADYKMDVRKANTERIVWIHKDEQEQLNQQRQYQFSPDVAQIISRPYIQPITQICQKDTIEIAINLYCLQGIVDIESIEWLDCDMTIPPKENVISYDKDVKMRAAKDKAQKIYCDMSRICELEDAVVEWYDSRYFQRQKELLNLDFLNELFTIKKYECAGIDGLISKIQLQATREGRLVNEFLGIPLVVKDTKPKGNSRRIDDDLGLVNEVKRLGLLIDRYVDLELRIGDTLVIYISRGQL